MPLGEFDKGRVFKCMVAYQDPRNAIQMKLKELMKPQNFDPNFNEGYTIIKVRQNIILKKLGIKTHVRLAFYRKQSRKRFNRLLVQTTVELFAFQIQILLVAQQHPNRNVISKNFFLFAKPCNYSYDCYKRNIRTFWIRRGYVRLKQSPPPPITNLLF